MALSSVQYSATEGQKTFTIPFTFLADAHVKAKIDGVIETDFDINSAGTELTFGTLVTIGAGAVIFIYRETPNTVAGRLIDFTPGSPVTESDLDTSAIQTLLVTQEAYDQSVNALRKAVQGDGNFDAEGLQVRNIAAPALENDAARLADVQAAQVSAGSLPVPTSSQENYLLAVRNATGSWQPPAFILAALGLSGVVDDVEALQGGTVAGYCKIPEQAIRFDAQAGYYESSLNKLTFSDLTTFGVSNNELVLDGSDNSLQLAGGRWILFHIMQVFNDGGVEQRFKIALTNEINGSSVTTYENNFDLSLRETGADMSQQFMSLAMVENSTTFKVCVRSVTATNTGGASVQTASKLFALRLPQKAS